MSETNTNNTVAEEVFNEAEAAKYLHQKPRTIRLWRRTRGLPFYQPTGKVVLLRRRDIDAWLDRTRTVICL